MKLTLQYKSSRVIDDVKTGADAKAYRESKNVAQNEVAMRMGKSPQHLHKLEKGECHWSETLCAQYQKAVNFLAKINDMKRK